VVLIYAGVKSKHLSINWSGDGSTVSYFQCAKEEKIEIECAQRYSDKLFDG
jgi:hypothetical protein